MVLYIMHLVLPHQQLLQATENLPGLQAQNLAGEWIDVLPKKNTLVVNFGKGTLFHILPV